jgi:hypothetical protein
MAFTRRGKMHKAVKAGDLKTVTRLLDAGFDPNDSTFGGVSPLLIAVFEGQKPVVELLIGRGADFSTLYNHDAYTGGRWASLLHVAAARGHLDIAALLLERDRYDHALLNRQDGQRNTALHYAAANGHAAVVRLLLDNGFDPALKGANEKLAVGYAYAAGHKDIVDMLTPQPKVPAKPAAAAARVETPPAPKPETAKDAPREVPAEEWERSAQHCVTHVQIMESLGYRIADVFNFASRERIRIVNNLKTKADNVTTTGFDDLPDRRQLEEAYHAFLRLGGAPDETVLGPKPAPRPGLPRSNKPPAGPET